MEGKILNYIKWVAASLIMASLFALVILGKMSPGEYIGLSIGLLSGMGVYHVTRFQGADK